MIDLKNRKSIIYSILDNDLYKFTMQQAVLELFPDAVVEYRFKNRGTHRFPPEFLSLLRAEIDKMADLRLTEREFDHLKTIPFFKPAYLAYLNNYQYDPSEVRLNRDENGDLEIRIVGKWHSTILWEVPLMAIISELFFQKVDTEWDHNLDNAKKKAYDKGLRLADAGLSFADFGTRRRRSLEVQMKVVEGLRDGAKEKFVGTSNLLLSMLYGLRCIGTMAHEWSMGMSVLESLRQANFYALQNWVRVYNADLGIALTDTYGLKAFLTNFNRRLTKLYDGVRHDSGDPFEFTERIMSHYRKYGVDPATKTIVFSDGLNTDSAIEIFKRFENKIKMAFGIGTHFTNDFEGSPALNMVIKLWSVFYVPVVKLSETPGKVMGDPDAVRVAKWTFLNTPLDEK